MYKCISAQEKVLLAEKIMVGATGAYKHHSTETKAMYRTSWSLLRK